MNPAEQLGRRRSPRRDIDGPVGLLSDGVYMVERCFQVGEGGILISSSRPLKPGMRIMVSFFILNNPMVSRGVIRSVIPAKGQLPTRYGIEFENLNFNFKREIRNFVALSITQVGD